MASKKIVTGSVVRAWAADPANLATVEGLPEGYTVGRQGRLHPAIRAAYEKATGTRYVVGHKVPQTVTVTAIRVSEKGRKTPITKKVVVSEARAAALAAGLPVGARGRVTQDVLRAFALGTLSASAE